MDGFLNSVVDESPMISVALEERNKNESFNYFEF